MSNKVPSKWHVPDGWVLTWYPPFTFPYKHDPNMVIQVYDDAEPFVPAIAPNGSLGYSPNTSPAVLSDFDGVHPGVYALNIQGEEPGVWVSPGDPESDEPAPTEASPLHPSALQIYGKKV